MRLEERHCKLLDMANWIVPLGWMYAAVRFHLQAWLVLAGFLLGFLAVNFRFAKPASDNTPDAQTLVRRPLHARPSFWLLLCLPAYIAYLVFQSGWLLWYLLIAGVIGVAVATLLRRRYQQAS